MIVWTNQPYVVYQKLMHTGSVSCDPQKSDNLNSTILESNRIFQRAYAWMIEQLRAKVGPASVGVTYPIWAWYRQNFIHRRPDLRERHDYADQVCIELGIPEEDILLSDFSAWHFLLNDWYNNDATNEKEWEEKERWFDNLPAEKQKIVTAQSWQRIFDITPQKDNWTMNGKYVQACFWLLQKEQVRRVWRLRKGHRVKELAVSEVI